MPLATLPSWYCPPGVPLPAYVYWQQATQTLCPGHGPDVDAATTDEARAAAAGGGQIFGGGGYVDRQPGWVRTPAGYWVRFTGAAPQYLGRLDTHPRIVRWATVPGTEAGQEWIIPVLVAPVLREREEEPKAFQSALERVWGQQGWRDAPDLVPLQERLRTVAQGLLLPGDGYGPMIDLVVDLIAQGHHSLGRAELEAVGWVTQRLVIRLFAAAAGLVVPGG